MSRGVDLVVGASIVWIDFLMPFKTHQVKSPQSGILVFSCDGKNIIPRGPINDDRQQSRSGARPVFDTSRHFGECRSKPRRVSDRRVTDVAVRNCKNENRFLNLQSRPALQRSLSSTPLRISRIATTAR